MPRHYSSSIRAISVITLIAFLSTQIAWGYDGNKMHLRQPELEEAEAQLQNSIADAIGVPAEQHIKTPVTFSTTPLPETVKPPVYKKSFLDRLKSFLSKFMFLFSPVSIFTVIPSVIIYAQEGVKKYIGCTISGVTTGNLREIARIIVDKSHSMSDIVASFGTKPEAIQHYVDKLQNAPYGIKSDGSLTFGVGGGVKDQFFSATKEAGLHIVEVVHKATAEQAEKIVETGKNAVGHFDWSQMVHNPVLAISIFVAGIVVGVSVAYLIRKYWSGRQERRAAQTLKRLQDDIDKAQKILADTNTEIAEAQSRLKVIQEEIDTKQKELDQVTTELNKLTVAVEDLSEQKANLAQEITDLTTKKEELVSNLKNVQEEVSRTQEALSKLQGQIKTLETGEAAQQFQELARLQEEARLKITQLQSDISSLEQQRGEAEKKKERLATEQDALDKNIDKLVSNKQDLQTEVEALTADRDRLNGELADVKEELTDVRREISEAQETLERTRSEVKAAEDRMVGIRDTELKELQAERDALKQEIGELRQEKLELEEKVERLKAIPKEPEAGPTVVERPEEELKEEVMAEDKKIIQKKRFISELGQLIEDVCAVQTVEDEEKLNQLKDSYDQLVREIEQDETFAQDEDIVRLKQKTQNAISDAEEKIGMQKNRSGEINNINNRIISELQGEDTQIKLHSIYNDILNEIDKASFLTDEDKESLKISAKNRLDSVLQQRREEAERKEEEIIASINIAIQGSDIGKLESARVRLTEEIGAYVYFEQDKKDELKKTVENQFIARIEEIQKRINRIKETKSQYAELGNKINAIQSIEDEHILGGLINEFNRLNIKYQDIATEVEDEINDIQVAVSQANTRIQKDYLKKSQEEIEGLRLRRIEEFRTRYEQLRDKIKQAETQDIVSFLAEELMQLNSIAELPPEVVSDENITNLKREAEETLSSVKDRLDRQVQEEARRKEPEYMIQQLLDNIPDENENIWTILNKMYSFKDSKKEIGAILVDLAKRNEGLRNLIKILYDNLVRSEAGKLTEEDMILRQEYEQVETALNKDFDKPPARIRNGLPFTYNSHNFQLVLAPRDILDLIGGYISADCTDPGFHGGITFLKYVLNHIRSPGFLKFRLYREAKEDEWEWVGNVYTAIAKNSQGQPVLVIDAMQLPSKDAGPFETEPNPNRGTLPFKNLHEAAGIAEQLIDTLINYAQKSGFEEVWLGFISNFYEPRGGLVKHFQDKYVDAFNVNLAPLSREKRSDKVTPTATEENYRSKLAEFGLEPVGVSKDVLDSFPRSDPWTWRGFAKIWSIAAPPPQPPPQPEPPVVAVVPPEAQQWPVIPSEIVPEEVFVHPSRDVLIQVLQDPRIKEVIEDNLRKANQLKKGEVLWIEKGRSPGYKIEWTKDGWQIFKFEEFSFTEILKGIGREELERQLKVIDIVGPLSDELQLKNVHVDAFERGSISLEKYLHTLITPVGLGGVVLFNQKTKELTIVTFANKISDYATPEVYDKDETGEYKGIYKGKEINPYDVILEKYKDWKIILRWGTGICDQYGTFSFDEERKVTGSRRIKELGEAPYQLIILENAVKLLEVRCRFEAGDDGEYMTIGAFDSSELLGDWKDRLLEIIKREPKEPVAPVVPIEPTKPPIPPAVVKPEEVSAEEGPKLEHESKLEERLITTLDSVEVYEQWWQEYRQALHQLNELAKTKKWARDLLEQELDLNLALGVAVEAHLSSEGYINFKKRCIAERRLILDDKELLIGGVFNYIISLHREGKLDLYNKRLGRKKTTIGMAARRALRSSGAPTTSARFSRYENALHGLLARMLSLQLDMCSETLSEDIYRKLINSLLKEPIQHVQETVVPIAEKLFGLEDILDKWIKLLDDKDPAVQDTAIKAISKISENSDTYDKKVMEDMVERYLKEVGRHYNVLKDYLKNTLSNLTSDKTFVDNVMNVLNTYCQGKKDKRAMGYLRKIVQTDEAPKSQKNIARQVLKAIGEPEIKPGPFGRSKGGSKGIRQNFLIGLLIVSLWLGFAKGVSAQSQHSEPPSQVSKISLVNKLKNEEWEIRQEAARKLGELGDKSAIEALVKTLLDDSDADVKNSAVKALVKLGYLEQCNNKDVLMKIFGIDPSLLDKISQEKLADIFTDDDVGLLLADIEDNDSDTQIRAVKILGKLKEKQATKPLLEILDKNREELGNTAAISLGEIGGRGVIRPLFDSLKSKRDWQSGERIRAMDRGVVVEALSKVGEAAVDELIKALDNKDERISSAASEALSKIKISIPIESFTPFINKRLNHWNPYKRQQAVVVLTRIGEPAVRPLVKAFGQDAWFVRQGALEAITNMKLPFNGEYIDPILEALGDPNPDVRWRAAMVLSQVPSRDSRIVPSLLPLLMDESAKVRCAAVIALGNMKDVRAVDGLISVLDDSETVVVRKAIIALGEIGEPRAISPIISVANKYVNASPQVYKACFVALGRLASHWSGNGLIDIVRGNGDSVVRQRAALILGKIANSQAETALWELVKSKDINVDEGIKICAGRALYSKNHYQVFDDYESNSLLNVMTNPNAIKEDVKKVITEWLKKRNVRNIIVLVFSGENETLRNAAIEVFGEIGKPAVDALISFLDDDDIRVRKAVSDALVNIGKPAVPALLEAIWNKDNNGEKWSSALVGLRRIDYMKAQQAYQNIYFRDYNLPKIIKAAKDYGPLYLIIIGGIGIFLGLGKIFAEMLSNRKNVRTSMILRRKSTDASVTTIAEGAIKDDGRISFQVVPGCESLVDKKQLNRLTDVISELDALGYGESIKKVKKISIVEGNDRLAHIDTKTSELTIDIDTFKSKYLLLMETEHELQHIFVSSLGKRAPPALEELTILYQEVRRFLSFTPLQQEEVIQALKDDKDVDDQQFYRILLKAQEQGLDKIQDELIGYLKRVYPSIAPEGLSKYLQDAPLDKLRQGFARYWEVFCAGRLVKELEHRYRIESHIARLMVTLHQKISEDAKKRRIGEDRSEPYQFTLRELRKWAELFKHYSDAWGPTKAFLKGAFYIYRDRMENAKDEKAFLRRVRELDLDYLVSIDKANIDLEEFLSDKGNLELKRVGRKIKVGDVELNIDYSSEDKLYVPDRKTADLVLTRRTIEDLEKIALAIELKDPLLLIGETGVGKNALLRYLAHVTNNNIQRFNLNGQTDKLEFIGGYKPSRRWFNREEAVEFINQTLASKDPKEELILVEAVTMVIGNRLPLNRVQYLIQNAISHQRYSTIISIAEALAKLKGLRPELKFRFEWHDGILIDAMKNGHWLDLDEINLAEPEVIERIRYLLEPNGYLIISEHRGERYISSRDYDRLIEDYVSTREGDRESLIQEAIKILEEKGIYRIHPNFRLFATMNPPSPGYEGRKPLSPAFMNKFRVKWIKELEENDIYEILEKKYGFRENTLKHLCKLYQRLAQLSGKYGKLGKDTAQPYYFTIRHFLRLADRLQDWLESQLPDVPNDKEINQRICLEAEEVYGDSLRNIEDQKIFAQMLKEIFGQVSGDIDIEVKDEPEKGMVSFGDVGLNINRKRGPLVPTATSSKLKLVSTTKRWLRKLARSIKMNEKLLLVGPTGVAKTSLLRYLAYRTNNNFVRVNLDAQTDIGELIGKFVPVEGTNQFQWEPGILVEAMEKGYWMLLDEFNLAEPEILERINSLLDEDGYLVLTECDNRIVRPHPNFRLFAAMNPERYTGRNQLSLAMRNKFTEKWLNPDLPEEELKEIIEFYLTDWDVSKESIVPFALANPMASEMASAHQKIQQMIRNNQLGRVMLGSTDAGEYQFSLRDLKDWAEFIRRLSKELGTTRALIEGALYIYRDRLQGENDKRIFRDKVIKEINQAALGEEIINIDQLDVLEEEGKGVDELIKQKLEETKGKVEVEDIELAELLEAFDAHTVGLPLALRQEKGLPAIRKYLTMKGKENDGIRGFALLPPEIATPLLSIAIQSSKAHIRQAAAEVIGHLGLIEFNANLEQLLEDNEQAVRITAALSLEHLKFDFKQKVIPRIANRPKRLPLGLTIKRLVKGKIKIFKTHSWVENFFLHPLTIPTIVTGISSAILMACGVSLPYLLIPILCFSTYLGILAIAKSTISIVELIKSKNKALEGDYLGLYSFLNNPVSLFAVVSIATAAILFGIPLIFGRYGYTAGLFTYSGFLLGMAGIVYNVLEAAFQAFYSIVYLPQYLIIAKRYKNIPLDLDDFYSLLEKMEGKHFIHFPFTAEEKEKILDTVFAKCVLVCSGLFGSLVAFQILSAAKTDTLPILPYVWLGWPPFLKSSVLLLGGGISYFITSLIFLNIVVIREMVYKPLKAIFLSARTTPGEKSYIDTLPYDRETIDLFIKECKESLRERATDTKMIPTGEDPRLKLRREKIQIIEDGVLIDTIKIPYPQHTAKSTQVFVPETESAELIPTVSTVNNLKKIALSVLIDDPVLLIGETGVGKTSLVRYVACLSKNNFRRFNLSGQTDKTEFIGGYKPDPEGNFHWVDGILIRAMREGHWLVLDEINLAESQVLERINSLLDDDRYLRITEHNHMVWYRPERYDTLLRDETRKSRSYEKAALKLKQEGIHRIHPNFRLFATMNPAEYAGRKILSPALMNRFRVKWIDESSSIEKRLVLLEKFQDERGHFVLGDGLLDYLDLFHDRIKETAKGQFIGSQERDPYHYTLRDLLKVTNRSVSRVRDIEEKEKTSLSGFYKEDILGQEVIEVYTDRIRDVADKEAVDVQIGAVLGEFSREEDLSVKETDNSVSFGEIVLSKDARVGPYIPGEEAKLALTPTTVGYLKRIAKAIVMDENILLVGPTGSAKTSFFRHLAYVTKTNFVRMNLDAQTDTSELIGQYVPMEGKRGEFCWQDGILVRALKEGWRILLDEINLAEPEILERINSLLDDDKCLVITEHENEKLISSKEYEKKLNFYVKEYINAGLSEPEGRQKAAERLTQENIFRIHPDFRLFAAMNPERYAGRNRLSMAMRNKFTEIWVPGEWEHSELVQLIEWHLDKYLKDPALRGRFTEIAEDMAAVHERITEIAPFLEGGGFEKYQFSVRELHSWARYLGVFIPQQGLKMAFSNAVKYLYYDRFTQEEDRKKFREHIEGLHLIDKKVFDSTSARSAGRTDLIITDDSIKIKDVVLPLNNSLDLEYVPSKETSWLIPTKSTIVNLERVAYAIVLGEPLLLIGETGVGKTSFVRFLAYLTKNGFRRFNLSGQTEKIDFIGGYQPGEDGAFRWHEGILIEALREGHWLVLDEINLAPAQIVERLNSLLDDDGFLVVTEHENEKWVKAQEYDRRREELLKNDPTAIKQDEKIREYLFINNAKIYRIHPNFRLFATMNPAEYAGRQLFSPALMNRFRVKWVDELSREDMRQILQEKYSDIIPTNLLNICLDIHSQMQKVTKELYDNRAYYTIRHLLRWLERVKAGIASGSTKDLKQLISLGAKEVYGDSLSSFTEQDPQRGLKVFLDNLLAEKLGKDYQDDNVEITIKDDIVYFGEIGLKKNGERTKHIPGPALLDTPSSRRYLKKIAKAVLRKEPLLLVGPTGGGKTSLPRHLADIVNHDFMALDLDGQTDIPQLIGQFVPLEGEEGKYEWRDGLLVKAVKEGSWFLIDEFNLAEPEILERINSLLDDDGYLVLSEYNNEKIMPHPEFRLFAAMNPEQDAGRSRLSLAMLNKFSQIWVSEEQPEPEKIKITEHYLNQQIPKEAHLAEEVTQRSRQISMTLPQSFEKFQEQSYTQPSTLREKDYPVDRGIWMMKPKLFRLVKSSSAPSTGVQKEEFQGPQEKGWFERVKLNLKLKKIQGVMRKVELTSNRRFEFPVLARG